MQSMKYYYIRFHEIQDMPYVVYIYPVFHETCSKISEKQDFLQQKDIYSHICSLGVSQNRLML